MATLSSLFLTSIGTARFLMAKAFDTVLVTTSISSSKGSIFLKGIESISATALIMVSSVRYPSPVF